MSAMCQNEGCPERIGIGLVYEVLTVSQHIATVIRFEVLRITEIHPTSKKRVKSHIFDLATF